MQNSFNNVKTKKSLPIVNEQAFKIIILLKEAD
jgi:hypothetical protein